MVRFVINDHLGHTHIINADKGEYLQTSGEFVQILQPSTQPGEIGDALQFYSRPRKFIAAFCRPTSIFKEEFSND